MNTRPSRGSPSLKRLPNFFRLFSRESNLLGLYNIGLYSWEGWATFDYIILFIFLSFFPGQQLPTLLQSLSSLLFIFPSTLHALHRPLLIRLIPIPPSISSLQFRLSSSRHYSCATHVRKPFQILSDYPLNSCLFKHSKLHPRPC